MALNPADFGPIGTSDDTATIQAAINYGVLHQQPLLLEDAHLVSQVAINAANRFIIEGGGVLRGIGGGPAVLTLKNSTAVVIDGLNVDASNLTYNSAVKAYSDGPTSSLNDLRVNCQNARLGICFGDTAFPDVTLSENILRHGYFYNCAQGIAVIGSQAVLSIDHFQNITDATNWAGTEQVGLWLVGSTVHVVGGELIGAANVDYAAIVNKALASGFGNTYAIAHLDSVVIESPGRLMRSDNSGVASPHNGFLSVRGSHGFIGSDAHDFIELDAAFDGVIDIDESNRFNSSVTRTKYNARANTTATHLRIADAAFAGGCKNGATGLLGGAYEHPQVLVLDATNTNNQPVLNGGWSKLVYTANNTAPQRFRDCYSAGTFTVPAGGLKNIVVTSVVPTNVPTAEISIHRNGSEVSNNRIAYAGQLVCMFDTLSAGDTIEVFCIGIAGSGVVAGGVKDKFQIMAAA